MRSILKEIRVMQVLTVFSAIKTKHFAILSSKVRILL